MNDGSKVKDLGYTEAETSLQVRINAHKMYSNFSLEDWCLDNLEFSQSDTVLDIGCGSGNLFELYSRLLGEQGLIIGVDQGKELLWKAHKLHIATPKVLLHLDFNSNIPLLDHTVDHIISTFAIYYANSSEATLLMIKRLLRAGGTITLIGPSRNNARELMEFNGLVLGRSKDDKASLRSARLESEFYPDARRIIGNAEVTTIPSKLLFPNKEEFVKYYLATLLYKEAVEQLSVAPTRDAILGLAEGYTELNKEMVVVRCRYEG